MRRFWCVRALRLLAAALGGCFMLTLPLAPLQAAPQTFNTALPVARGDFVFREQFMLVKSSDDPSSADRDVTAWAVVSALGYGVNSDFALFGVLPYVNKQLKVTAGGMRFTRQAAGVGDLKLFGRYTIFKNNAPGKSLRIAPFAGIKIPTGEHHARDALGRLPAGVQPGSGSWDAFGGVVTTYQTLNYQIDTQASYQVNTAASGFEFGDVARLDASLQYRLWPRVLSGGVPGFLYGLIEANFSHQNKNRSGGVRDPNSGGTTLLLSPGLQYVTKRWILETTVQVPLVQNLNGSALKNDYVLRAGLRINI